MVKLKQVVMPLIELIQENNTKNKLPLRYKGYADMNPCLLSVHDHQVILEKLKQEKILTMMNMWKKKITTMLIVMNLILMRINNYYYMFNLFWTTTGGTALIACKTPTNSISSVSLPEHIKFNEAFVSGNANYKLESNIHLTQDW